jgi:hypothetical protein
MLSKQCTISSQRPRKQFSMTSAAGFEIIVVDTLWRDVLLLQQLTISLCHTKFNGVVSFPMPAILLTCIYFSPIHAAAAPDIDAPMIELSRRCACVVSLEEYCLNRR